MKSGGEAPTIVIRGTPGQIDSGSVCKGVDWLSKHYASGKEDPTVAETVARYLLMPIYGISALAQYGTQAVGYVDEKVVPTIGSAVGLSEASLENRQSSGQWGVRAGLGLSAVIAREAWKARGGSAFSTSAMARTTALGTLDTLRWKNWGKYGFALWALSSGALHSTQKWTDHIPVVKDLHDGPRQVADLALGGALVAASMAFVHDEYTPFMGAADAATATKIGELQKLGAAASVAQRKELRNLTHLPLRAGLKWTLGWLAAYSYIEIVKSQQRSLAAIDGIDGVGRYVPFWKWKWDYFNPDLWTNNFTSWAGSAPAWGFTAVESRQAADWWNHRLFKNGGQAQVMPLSEFEMARYRTLAAPEGAGLAESAAARVAQMRYATGRLVGSAARRRYTGLFFANGVLISTVVGRMMASARGFQSPETLERASVRMVFSRALNTFAVTPQSMAKVRASTYGYYLPGMATIIPAYDVCSERRESLLQLAEYQMRRYGNASNPAKRQEIAIRMRTFEAAAKDQKLKDGGTEYQAIKKLLDKKRIPTFSVRYEKEIAPNPLAAAADDEAFDASLRKNAPVKRGATY